ncbi:MAG: hypothetical protein AB1810_09680 [Pseudomonadota bacterium]
MITIQINDREVRDALAELQRRVADMRLGMAQVGGCAKGGGGPGL